MKETQETLRADIEGLYGPLKALSEQEAGKWFPGITTVIRPGLIVGPGDESDRFTYWPVRLDRGGDVLAPGDGNDPVQFVDARDLAEWTIRMVEARTLGVFNAMGPASELTMAGMLDGIQGGIGSKARLVWAPADFLEQQKVSAWGDMPVWVPAAGRHRGRQPPPQPEGDRRRPHLPTAGADGGRHPGLVEDAARRPAGEAARRHRVRARGAGPGGLEGEEGLASPLRRGLDRMLRAQHVAQGLAGRVGGQRDQLRVERDRHRAHPGAVHAGASCGRSSTSTSAPWRSRSRANTASRPLPAARRSRGSADPSRRGRSPPCGAP